ncbi:MAG TPA: endolytic transglycosylase MltG [Vicinamibacterales bacterium]|nr:endolytic transglycosylase MltG [Vicinamibacterales bacterium]
MLKRLGILFLVVMIAAIGGAWWMSRRLATPYRGFEAAEVFVEIPRGTSVSGIARRLADAGVVPDAFTFRIAASMSGAGLGLQAGEYRFAEPASPYDVVARIARGDVFVHPITFREGLTIKEMAPIFEKSGLGTAAEFERAASDGSLIAAIDPEARNLEGYLFPETYALPRNAGATGVVRAMVDGFEKAYDAGLRAAATAQQMSPREVVTLASIIEKETGQAAERPLVAAVYRNRLRIGMALQCDPTVIYALMLARRWNGNLTRQNMQIDSPYNTYRYAGLPPGPIASPGRASIDAALHPADVPYLYFVGKGDGTHAFATTLAEHNVNVRRYQIGR